VSDLIESTRDGNVALLRIDRPEARNALSPEVMEELASELERLDPDPEVRCVVIAGSEKVFAAGADIKAMAERGFAEALRHPAASFWRRLAAIKTPMVAAVSGYALGGGCELALACDMIVAAEGAQFGQPEINLGIIPGGGGTQRLARVLGRPRRSASSTASSPTASGSTRRWRSPAKSPPSRRSPRASPSRRSSSPRRPPSPPASRTSAASTSWRWRPRTASRACGPS
jgi:enoyl-CoA hydratase/carnithine racemase